MSIPKDFCFLWYVGDWMGGTDLFTREMKGVYHDLLMTQANNGHLSERQIKIKLDQEDNHYQKYWIAIDDIKKKFILDSDGLFFNEKIEKEILRRQKNVIAWKGNLTKESPSGEASGNASGKASGNRNRNRKRKGKEEKKNFSTYVKLTQKQYDDIRDKHLEGSDKLMEVAIEKLDAYIESKGDKYKSHAGALRSWVVKQVMSEQAGDKGAYL